MGLQSWISSSLVRHYPGTPGRVSVPLKIDAALNERFSFQVAMRADSEGVQRVRVEAVGPPGWSIRVRRVGYVPMQHHNMPVAASDADMDGRGRIPGFVPDPLYDDEAILLAPQETHAFWFTVRPSPDALPGNYAVSAIVQPDTNEPTEHWVDVTLHGVRLRRRVDFAVTQWFYVDSLIDWYKTDLFDERFWSIAARYIADVVEHGQDTLYIPVFTPPLDGVKRPSQLLRVERTANGVYSFNWRDVKRYIDLAKRSGVSNFEWCHFFTQWGARHAIRIYEGQGREERLLWDPDTAATSDTYRAFLSQYLPQLRRFLEVEAILDRSLFHVSDEPHGEGDLVAYGEARGLLRELAPWIRVMDALTEIEFAQRGLIDMPVPSIRTALDFVAAGIPGWCYYCCGPRGEYVNRLLDTPLPKIAMHGLLFYRWPLRGFLHWGYNYWYESQTRRLIDPFTVQDGLAWERGWAYGDTFLVYPGSDGPIDSMRWEVFGESLQDYALLQTLGVRRDDDLLTPIRGFQDFPKGAEWRLGLRRRLLTGEGS